MSVPTPTSKPAGRPKPVEPGPTQDIPARSGWRPIFGGKRPKTTMGSIVELVVIILVAVGLAFGIQAWVVKPYRIPSGSMEPTLTIGQRVLVNRIGTHFSKPHVGEIAVFHPPEGATNEECGSGTRIVPGGAPCSEPLS